MAWLVLNILHNYYDFISSSSDVFYIRHKDIEFYVVWGGEAIDTPTFTPKILGFRHVKNIDKHREPHQVKNIVFVSQGVLYLKE